MEKNNLSPSTIKIARVCLFITGIVLILIAFLFNSLTSATDYPNWSKAVIVMLGAILTSFGLVIGKKRQFFCKILKHILAFFVAFFVVEFLGIISLFLLGKFEAETEIDPKDAILMVTSGSYRPYVLWIASPQSTLNSTILNSGLRAVPGASSDPSAIQVFVFGGSTIVGWNIPDQATICAQIQKHIFPESNEQICVTNFGQQGYVNTQELIELQLQLRSGNIPDLVIFYDGINEMWAAVKSDTVGVHLNLQEITDLYENRNFTRDNSAHYGILHFAGKLNTINLLRKILGYEITIPILSLFEDEPSQCLLYGEDFIAAEDFAKEIMNIYEGNLRILRALSEEFDFEYRVFWQPIVLTGNKPLTHSEDAIYNNQNFFLLQLSREGELLTDERENKFDNFYCISDIFDGVEETVFQDICHLNALGDSLIAERIILEL